MATEPSAVPLHLVTGFLGAGKTTLIRSLIGYPEFARTAILVNELGEIGLDQELLGNSTGPTAVLLENGCICCTLNNDLALSLREMLIARDAGEIPHFDRIVVETTGIADPGSILRVLICDRWLTQRVQLHGVVTLVDARAALPTLEETSEASAQIATADLLVVSKRELASADDVIRLEHELRRLNEQAPIVYTADGPLTPAELEAAMRLRCNVAVATPDRSIGHSDGSRHSHRVNSVSLRFARKFAWSDLSNALDRAASLHRDGLLRCKGLLATRDADRPVFVDGVRDAFHPPMLLPKWPSGDRDSRLVMIGRADSAQAALQSFVRSVGLDNVEG